MRILLVNEASGVHNYLKRGLIKLGHEVVLAGIVRENKQSRNVDLNLSVSGSTKIEKILSVLDTHRKVAKIKGFDLVNYINTLSVFSTGFNRYLDISMLRKSGARISYYGLGCDEAGLLRVRNDADALPCASCIKNDLLGQRCERTTLKWRSTASNYSDLFDFSVSSAYVYSHCHDFFGKAKQANIQLPIDVSVLPFEPARSRAKPVIVHSPTRRGFKGTESVLEAISQLGNDRSDFEFRLIENLTHDKYLEAMRECDIYVDQVYSCDAHGVAALENLASGKIVISGNGPLNWKEFPFAESAPIVPASPNSRVLAEKLSHLLDRKSEFDSMAGLGREYVAKHHDNVMIASLFVKLWSKSF